MKYKNLKISSLLLLGSLILISSMNGSVVRAFPAYIGVAVGDEFVWTIDTKSDGIEPLLQDYNNSANLGNGSVTLPSWLSSEIIDIFQLELAINVTAEGGAGVVSGIDYTHIACIGAFRLIGVTVETIPSFNVPIYNSSMLYFNQTILDGLNETIDGFTDVKNGTLFLLALFVSPSIDWAALVSEFKQARDNVLGDSASAITIKALSDGFQIIIAEDYYNETHSKELSISMQYNDNGVLTRGEVKYDGNTAVLITEGPSSIPGFELPLIIGTSAIAIVSVIYIIKKKNKI